jgi:formamidopyrimidine-DNA glycosylase
MPEIIEARECMDFIKKFLKKKIIISIKILKGRYKKKVFENYKKLQQAVPLKLIDGGTKGKLLYLIFDNEMCLINNLGLVGGWIVYKDNKYFHPNNFKKYFKYGEKESVERYIKNSLNHLNFEIVTNNGTLYYHDMLSYGRLKYITSLDLNSVLNKLGPDIMDNKTTLEVFRNQIIKKNNLEKEIGNVIVNQKIISGLGNYLRADILWCCKIDPFRKVKKLSDIEICEIYNNSRIITWGFYNKNKGVELKIINNNTKFPSDYNRLFFIYMQEYDIYGNKVVKKELYEGSQKRFITYVPSIQK